MKRKLSYDPLTGVTAWHEYDSVTKETHITHTYDDVDPLLDLNKVRANHVNPYNADRDMKHVASIPAEIYTKWLLEEGLDIFNKDHNERLFKKLNDPDWLYLRTSTGKL